MKNELEERYFNTLGIYNPPSNNGTPNDSGTSGSSSTSGGSDEPIADVSSDVFNKKLIEETNARDSKKYLNKRKKALKRAHEIRKFEIERYWQRANYFWLFQAAIFTAVGFFFNTSSTALPKVNLITIALVMLGVMTSFANLLSAKGSKFWQENWEKHIDMLEDNIEGRLYKTVWLDKGVPSFSVSKINITLNRCFVIFWCATALYIFHMAAGSPYKDTILGFWAWWWPCIKFIFLISILVFGILWMYCQESALKGTYPSQNGEHGTAVDISAKWKRPFKRLKILFCNKTEEDEKAFMRRYAPHEKP